MKTDNNPKAIRVTHEDVESVLSARGWEMVEEQSGLIRLWEKRFGSRDKFIHVPLSPEKINYRSMVAECCEKIWHNERVIIVEAYPGLSIYSCEAVRARMTGYFETSLDASYGQEKS